MNILITGASRGIGAALTKKASRDPKNRVFITARNRPKMEKLLKDGTGNSNVVIIPADLSLPDSVKTLVNSIMQHTDRLDILVNNAGFLRAVPFEEQDYQMIYDHFVVNYIGPSMLIKECVPLLRKTENPHVVNISSMGGFQGSEKFPGLSHYSASKAAIAALTECLVKEFDDIRFNCLCIGSVQTEMLEEAFPGYKASLTPDEMAEYVINFSMEAHKYMNGRIIPVAFSSP